MEDKKNETAAIRTNSVDPGNWVANHADYLYSYAMTRINDEEQAKDLVQDTFLAGLEKLDNFEGRSSERTWLTSILKNKVVDVYRKKSSGLRKAADVEVADSTPEDFFNASDGHWKARHQPKAFGIESYDPLMDKEFQGILQKCMQSLPALWLAVFTMKHIDNHDTETICSELKVTSSNFWVVIHRAKVNLRSCLQKNWI